MFYAGETTQRIRGFAFMRYINLRLIDWLIDLSAVCVLVSYLSKTLHISLLFEESAYAMLEWDIVILLANVMLNEEQ